MIYAVETVDTRNHESLQTAFASDILKMAYEDISAKLFYPSNLHSPVV
jgi:hypothetical protein